MSEWVVQQVTPDSFDITEDTKAVAYDVPTLDEAEDIVRSQDGSGYTLIEEDGYQTRKEL